MHRAFVRRSAEVQASAIAGAFLFLETIEVDPLVRLLMVRCCWVHFHNREVGRKIREECISDNLGVIEECEVESRDVR